MTTIFCHVKLSIKLNKVWKVIIIVIGLKFTFNHPA